MSTGTSSKAVGVQADRLGISEFWETFENVQKRLSEYEELNMPMQTGTQQRGLGMSETVATVDRISAACSSMMDMAAQMEQAIKSNEADLARLEQEHAKMSKKKVDLLSEQRKVIANHTLHELGRKVSQNRMMFTNNDMVSEAHLRDYAEDEVEQNSADLKAWREKVATKSEELRNEWSALNADIAGFREEKRPHYAEIDETNNLITAKLRGFLEGGTSEDGMSESDAVNRTIQYLENERELRSLKNTYEDKQLNFRKEEQCLGFLNAKKGALWRYYLGIERMVQPNNKRSGGGSLLRPAAARFDVAFKDREKPDYVTSEEDIVYTLHIHHAGGKLLHRCSKHTDLLFHVSPDEASPEMSSVTAEHVQDEAVSDESSDDDNEDNSDDPDGEDETEDDSQENTSGFVAFPRITPQMREKMAAAAEAVGQANKSTYGAIADRPPEMAGTSSSEDTDGGRFELMSKLRKRMVVQSSSSQQKYQQFKPLEAAGRTGSSTNIKPFSSSKKSRR